VLEVKKVTKSYYSLVAVNQVSFDIPSGEVVGLLGPNGAGKTTLLKLIAGFLTPDAGSIRPVSNHWPTIGLKPERLLYPHRMRVADYLRVFTRLTATPGDHRQVVQRVLDQVGLREAMNKRISDCSKGMRQRLGLAQVLIGDPPLLLLDEPTNGLDPEGQMAICRLIQQLHAGGKTILLCSHQLHEVTQVCTRLVILNKGAVHYANTMAEALTLRPHVTIEADRPLDDLAPLLTALDPGIVVEERMITLNEPAIHLRRHILSIVLSAGFDVLDVAQKRVTLEEIYAEAVQ
jgi:ABC-2 type transport system ATP-binding protein